MGAVNFLEGKAPLVRLATATLATDFLKTCCAGRRHKSTPPLASWQYIRIYSPGGGAVQARWLFKTSATTFDLLTVKVVSESRVTWVTSVPNLVFQASLFST